MPPRLAGISVRRKKFHAVHPVGIQSVHPRKVGVGAQDRGVPQLPGALNG